MHPAKNSSTHDQVHSKKEHKAECCFTCGGALLMAETKVLAEHSPVFKCMFYGELSASEIHILDISPEVLNQVIRYITQRELTISSSENAWDLIYVCKKYMIDELVGKCVLYLMDNFTLDSLLLSYEYAQFYSIGSLIKCYNGKILTFTKDFLCVDYHMALSTLRIILNSKKVNATDSDLFILVVMWAMDECILLDVDPSIDNIWKTISDERLLDSINLHAFNPSSYKFTAYMLEMPCYSKINDVTQVISKLFREKLINKTTISVRKLGCGYKYRHRRLYKISKALRVPKSIYSLTTVSVADNANIFLLGLALTVMRPSEVSNMVCGGKIDIRISVVEGSISVPYYNSMFVSDAITYCDEGIDEYDTVYAQFAVPVKFEYKKKYWIGLRYHNMLPYGSAELVLRYASENLSHNGKNAIIFGNEFDGSVIHGVAFISA